MQFAAIKTAAGCVSNIRPQFSLGCPEASQDLAEPEALLLVGTLICFSAEAGNNAKALETMLSIYPFCFHAVVHFSGTQIFVFNTGQGLSCIAPGVPTPPYGGFVDQVTWTEIGRHAPFKFLW